MIYNKKGDLEIETILIIILVLIVLVVGTVFIYLKGNDMLEALKNFFRAI